MAGVEILVVSGLSRTRTPTVHSPDFQILYPLSGVFHWHLGSTRSLLDQNQVLFIAAGDESQDSHPDRGDVAGLLITPDVRLLESIWGCSIDRLAAHVSFDRRVLPSDPGLQQIAAALSNCRLVSQPPDQAVLEEAVIDLLSLTVRRCGVPTAPGKSVHRLVGAVKEILAATDDRLSLIRLGEQLGLSPTYLTEAFRRSEGMPISRYHRRLRLARALKELPQTEDITDLALRFGFSSHAHFSSSFRAVFGRTPSDYRAQARRRDFRALLERVHPIST